MTRPQKRKRGSSVSAPAPRQKRFSWRGKGPVPRPTPNEETQELYNIWQEAEREVNYEEIRRLNEGATFVGHNEFLSPSQATSRSQSPSCTSATHSVTKTMTHIDLDQGSSDLDQGRSDLGQRRSKSKKKRATRTKPLSKPAKAKAAFIRKLGACEDCRTRRIGCTREHWDLKLFEDVWRVTHGPLPEEIEIKPTPPPEYFKSEWQIPRGLPPEPPKSAPAPEPEISNPYHSRYSELDDLAGVGGQVAYRTVRELERELEAVDEEIDNFLESLQEYDEPPLAAAGFTERYFEFAFEADFGYAGISFADITQPTRPPYVNPEPEGTSWLAVANYHYIPICKQTFTFIRQEQFECLGTFPLENNGGEFTCGDRYNTLESLTEHFFNVHYVFENPQERGKCLSCGLDWDLGGPEELTEPCKQCGRDQHEKWYWGFINKATPPSLTSGTTEVRVTGPDGMQQGGPPFMDQLTNPYGQDNGGGYGFDGGFSFGGYGDYGLHGIGDNQYHKAARHEMKMKHSYRLDANITSKTTPLLGSNSAFPLLVGFSFLSVMITHLYLNTGSACRHSSPSADFDLDLWAAFIPELSIACIAAGLAATWLIQHAVRYRADSLFDTLETARVEALEGSARAAVAA
ncbi:hypothetical protein B0T21DRAFT_294156 [Apiosordaria backusii]|uniref:Uncharacterized protein n=1 Tax=Apiosordaria backusii TaxID=314023 RepID=A0AA40AXB6_9PEZI|nr:hypothetical protein B0T21DRAFT_294156 [Apiosordaria backusii]